VPAGALRDVCLAQGAPASQIGFIQQPTAAQANVTTGGNFNLRPEESTSWTVGAVFTPSFLPRFSMTVDYYNIRVTGAISAPTTVDIVNGCFNSPSLSNPSCLLIRRDTITGGLNGDQNNVPGISLARSNLGRLAAQGIDVTVNFQRDLGFARWSMNASGNWASKSSFQASPASVDRDCVGVYNVSCTSLRPEFQWSVRHTLTLPGQFDVSLLWRHIDAMRASERLFSGNIPELGGSYDFNRIPSYDYFDLSLRQVIGDRYTLQFTVQNLLDKAPPIVGGTVGAGGFNSGNTFPSTYDTLGRRFAITAKVAL
jgi:outer membrane receptor protein involved in Fe transport